MKNTYLRWTLRRSVAVASTEARRGTVASLHVRPLLATADGTSKTQRRLSHRALYLYNIIIIIVHTICVIINSIFLLKKRLYFDQRENMKIIANVYYITKYSSSNTKKSL